MNRPITWIFAALTLVLAGCSNLSQTEATAGSAFVNSIGGLISGGNSEPAAKPVITRAQFAQVQDPALLVTLEEVDAIASVVRIASNNGADTYQGVDAISLTLRNGVLIATRGYNDDLMQSDMSGLQAALKRGQGTYSKSMSYLDSQDRFRTLAFRCDLRTAGRERIVILGKTHQTRRLQETCTGDGRQIDNTYWLDGSRMVRSRQWVADGVSRMMFEQIQ